MAINKTNIKQQITKPGSKLKDLSGDGKVTRKGALIGRGVLKKQGDKFVAAQYGGQISKIKRRVK